MTFRPLPYLLSVLALACLYFGAARLGLSLAFVAEQVTVVWPPTGIALAALVLFGYRLWPGIALGAFLANAMANEPYAVAAGIATGNTLEALAGAWLINHFVEFRPSLERLKDVLGLVLLAACVSTLVSATLGVTSLCLGRVHDWSRFSALWWTWWLGDAMGDLALAPLLLTWAARPRSLPKARWPEAVLLLIGLGVVSALVFTEGNILQGAGYSLEYTLFPFVIWAALRFGQAGSAAVTLLTMTVAIGGTLNGWGPFARSSLHESLMLLQIYMAVVAVTALLLAAVMTERGMGERRRAVSYAVTASLAEAPSLPDAVPRLLRAICESLEWDVGAVWLVDRHAGVLRCAETWHPASAKVVEFVSSSRERTFAPGIGLPGRVWCSGQPTWITDVTQDTNFPRATIAAREGLHGAFGIPIILGTEVLGVLEFFSRQIERPDENLLTLVAAVGAQIGLFTERMRAQEQVRFQAHLLDSIGQAAIATRPDGTIFYWNRHAEILYGWSAAQVEGRNVKDLLVAPSIQPQAAAIIDRVRAGEGWSGEFPVQRRDGSSFPALITITPVLDKAGKVVGIIGISSDISARKRAEQAARFLADVGAALAALVDRQSTLQKVARLAVPEFADLCAVDLVRADGALERVAVAHKDPAKIELARQLSLQYPAKPTLPFGPYRVLRTGQSELVSEVAEFHLLQIAQNEQHLRTLRELGLRSYIGVPLTVRGKTIGVVAFVAAESGRRYDDADLAVAEELARRASIALENVQLYSEVREADRRKDEFLAMLAHELRNPLAPIRNAMHILKTPGADAATIRRVRDMMERQVQHLVRLVDDLLDVSRIMRGRIELRKEPIELAIAVGRAVETAHPAIEAGGHQLSVSVAPEPIVVNADPVRLAQVIANLLNNAAKYTEPGGHISLTAMREGQEAVLRVRDTGIGIAPELLPKVFDLFVQADHSLDRSQGGMGIGLTLVRNIVEMHGGAVRAESQGPGCGSEFTIRLPTALEGATRQGRDPAKAGSPPPPRRRILVVDDNVDAAESLAMLLRLEGQEVAVAHDGTTALAVAAGAPPDLVFLDLGMPGMDGYEVARRLRQKPSLEKVILVALTGWGQEEDRRRTREAGFDQHLVKPVEPSLLQQVLAG